jgi:hypothetical protein
MRHFPIRFLHLDAFPQIPHPVSKLPVQGRADDLLVKFFLLEAMEGEFIDLTGVDPWSSPG